MPHTTEQHNILVVEDEWLIAIDYKASIEELGYHVVGPARNIKTAMELINENTIDAALLDINLGKQQSFPIALRLKEMDVPVAFITSNTRADIPEEFRSFDLLPKPLARVALKNHLAKVCAKK